MEKHFGDADEPDISRSLVAKVLASCEERFAREMERVQSLPKAVYGEDGGAQVAGDAGEVCAFILYK